MKAYPFIFILFYLIVYIQSAPILKKGDINELLDPALDGKYNEAEARRMALAASLCLIRSARLRPQISQVYIYTHNTPNTLQSNKQFSMCLKVNFRFEIDTKLSRGSRVQHS